MHGQPKTPNASTQAIEFDPSCSGQTHSNRSCADPRNVDTGADILLEYSVSHVKFVHCAARMPNSDKLCNSFCAAGTNGCLDFSLSLLAAYGSVSWPCRMWPGSKELRLAKESFASWRGSTAGWIPEKCGRSSVIVRRRDPVTMRKASLRKQQRNARG